MRNQPSSFLQSASFRRRVLASTAFFAGLLLLVFLIFRAGQSRGNQQATTVFATQIAQMATQTAQAAALVISAPTVNATPTPLLIPTSTATHTSTPTPTNTSTPTNTPTNTPSSTPTPTAIPVSEANWIERYQDRSTAALNKLIQTEFSTARANALLRTTAQEHGLAFVSNSFLRIEGNVWAVIAAPRTPNGRIHPILFWQEPNDRNLIRSQLLTSELSDLSQSKNRRNIPSESSDTGYTHLQTGLARAILTADNLGRFSLLLAEPANSRSLLSFYIFTQSQAAADFDGVWWSLSDPLWSIQAVGSEYSFVESEDGALLPDIEIIGPIISPNGENQGGDDLRAELGAPTVFIEEPPFARQQAQTTWSVDASSSADLSGYQLTNGELVANPLTTLGNILILLQSGNINDATDYTTRLDLLQQAFDLGLGDPAQWLAIYIDEDGNELLDGSISNTLRLFDNMDRSRAYDLSFERTESGSDEDSIESIFRLSGVEVVEEGFSRETVNAAATVAADANSATNQNGGRDGPVAVTLQVTPTPSPTATTSPTPLPTPTPTPTEPPSAVPNISPDEAGPVTGSVVTQLPSNLRAGPGIDFAILGALDGGTTIEYFGITNSGEWLLLRVNDSTSDFDGEIGWMARDLLQWGSALEVLPRFFANGTPVIPFTPTPFGQSTTLDDDTPASQNANAEPSADGAPELRIPDQGLQTLLPQLPLPETNELVLSVISDQIPADPNTPITVVDEENRSFQLNASEAVIEVWVGLFGVRDQTWTRAAAEFLWPNTTIYVAGGPNRAQPNLFDATQIRIIDPPTQARARLLDLPLLAQQIDNERIMALLGSQAADGLFLLERGGNLQEFINETGKIRWLSNDPAGGLWIDSGVNEEGAIAGSRSAFSWLRPDGSGIEIIAQPYYSISGVAADGEGNLWWIEVPQTVDGPWQLWRYNPRGARIDLYAQTDDGLFRNNENRDVSRIAPRLLSASLDSQGNISLLLDTFDAVRQVPHTGIFEFVLLADSDSPDQDNSASNRPARGELTQLLPNGAYRGPLQISPDGTRLAYFAYDAAIPSLTAGAVRPPNQLNVVPLQGPQIGQPQAVYETPDRTEFLAPSVVWRGADRLVFTRSRFSAESNLEYDQFGLVEIALPSINSANEAPKLSEHLLTEQQQVSDFVYCLDQQYTLLIIRTANGVSNLARWNGAGQPRPLFGLPASVDQTEICWQATAP